MWKTVNNEPHLQEAPQYREEEFFPAEVQEEAARVTIKSPEEAKARAKSAKPKGKNASKRVNDLKQTTRWLADSAFTTYFGKPAFHAYGNGNTNPTVGGSVYGDYLKSHNVNPETGENIPKYKQVYARAILGATVNDLTPIEG